MGGGAGGSRRGEGGGRGHGWGRASSDNILHSDVKKLAIMRERISKLS